MRFDRSSQSQKGFLLLEALIGLSIFSFGILAIMAMQANAMKMVNGSADRFAAASLLERIDGLMRAHTLSSTNGLDTFVTTCASAGAAPADVQAWAADVVRLLPGATCTIAIAAQDATIPCHRRATVTVNWPAHGSGTGVVATDLNQASNVFYIQTELGSPAFTPAFNTKACS